jgi:hypothetical protein
LIFSYFGIIGQLLYENLRGQNASSNLKTLVQKQSEK